MIPVFLVISGQMFLESSNNLFSLRILPVIKRYLRGYSISLITAFYPEGWFDILLTIMKRIYSF